MIKINDKTISSVYNEIKVVEKIYKGTLLVYSGWEDLIASGIPPLTLTKCKGVDLIDYKIYGNSVQDGTPAPETPIEVESVGEYDETTGKYKIPVKVKQGENIITTNIYLDEPLRKIGDYADYIDFKTRKIVRKVGEKILKGSDGNWSSTVTWGDHAFFIPNLKNMLSWGTTVGALCSHLQSYTGKTTTALSNQWVIGGSNIVLSNDNCLTSAELKTWLNENDVRITYPLNTPEEETIKLPSIPTIKGTTIIEIDSNVNSSYMEVVYKGKGELQLLDTQNNDILNSILDTDTNTDLNITNTEIIEILDEIIGG